MHAPQNVHIVCTLIFYVHPNSLNYVLPWKRIRRIWMNRPIQFYVSTQQNANYVSIVTIILTAEHGQPRTVCMIHGHLARYVQLRVRMRRECREGLFRHRLQRKPLAIDPGRIANPRWWGKRSRHSRWMRNPQFYVSGKRPMACIVCNIWFAIVITITVKASY